MFRKSMLPAVAFAMLTLLPLCRAQSPKPTTNSAVETQKPNLDSTIEMARAEMRAERNAIIIEAMDFSDKDAAAFWPIYRKYEYERSLLDDRRALFVKEYAEKYATLNDADAKAMTEGMLECDSGEIALRKKYFKELSKVLPATTVAKFFQLNNRIDLLMAMRVESSLPPLYQPPNPQPDDNEASNTTQQN